MINGFLEYFPTETNGVSYYTEKKIFNLWAPFSNKNVEPLVWKGREFQGSGQRLMKHGPNLAWSISEVSCLQSQLCKDD